ncbi:MAG: polyketide synthase PksN, partial [bacterium]
SWRQETNDIFQVQFDQQEDYQSTFQVLKEKGIRSFYIIDLWNLHDHIPFFESSNTPEQLQEQIEQGTKNGILHLFHITQTLMELKFRGKINLIHFFSKSHSLNSMVSGFAGSLYAENPRFIYQSIQLEEPIYQSTEKILQVAQQEIADSTASIPQFEIRYLNNKRLIKYWNTSPSNEVNQENMLKLRKQGTYIITGGLGGLGRIFAKYLATHFQAKLILTGRSETPKEEYLAEIRDFGAEVHYFQADVSKPKDIENLIQNTKNQCGAIHGIIHSAGTIDDRFLIQKNVESFHNLLSPKVKGSVYLDQATANENLDFFILFSSIASILGSPGQTDYASANRFMDNFAELREEQVKTGKRSGKTISVNWPYWKEGGMQLNSSEEEQLFKSLGMKALPIDLGIESMIQGAAINSTQLLPAYGNQQKIQEMLGIQNTPDNLENIKITNPVEQETNSQGENHSKEIEQHLKQLLSDILKMPESRVQPRIDFSDYGIDSVIVMSLTTELEKHFGTLPKTLFFEYTNIQELTEYFLENHQNKISELTGGRTTTEKTIPQKIVLEQSKETGGTNLLLEKMEKHLKQLLSDALKIPEHRIQPKNSFSDYGIDSVMVMSLTSALEKEFGSLPKTLFFEYTNVQELTEYFVEEHLKIVEKLFPSSSVQEEPTQPIQKPKSSVKKCPSKSRFIKKATTPPKKEAQTKITEFEDDIAIIGVSGRYPDANNLQEFWENLKSGKDSISEIPEDRWHWKDFFNEKRGLKGKMYSKWGGFIQDMDKFDPLFFGISPREAELMDPQERLLLQEAWGAIEDAGYHHENLFSEEESSLRDVGVFVGAMWGHYELFGVEERLKGNMVLPNSNLSAIANRISYFFNFRGPSMVFDTACSSSLTAIHLACESIKRGECRLAIAGGVNLSLHPAKYLWLSGSNFVADDGRCRSFGADGNGYVPGEGVGAILLKPLQKAIEDKDNIYSVIKGTWINHGGHTNGFTVPNPNAQAELISKVFERSNIDPETVSYLEAHGTGTSLGDPIEISGLNKAFGKNHERSGFCSIGSVKSNIGHLEAAAGIAAITKVLLQMKHQQIVPSLHSDKLNPNIDFEKSPFTVQQKLTDWKKPTIQRNGETSDIPRRAGISSFGAGGSNAHILLDEYDYSSSQFVNNENQKCVFVLSAKSDLQLKRYAKRFISYLDQEHLPALTNIAYTSQLGRESMHFRLAMVVSSKTELKNKLSSYLEGQKEIDQLFFSNIKKIDLNIEMLIEGETGEAFTHLLIEKQELNKIAQLWTMGGNIHWEAFYKENTPSKV